MTAVLPTDYPALLADIQHSIRTAQVKANLSVNRELIRLYWEIGGMIIERQQREGWGAGVIPRLAEDLRNELPDVKGFSERNIKRMTQFYREYRSAFQNVPQFVAQLPSAAESHSPGKGPQPVAQLHGSTAADLSQLVVGIPWGHNILLIEKIKNMEERIWYMQQTIQNGWSRNVLALQIDSDAYRRAAQAVTNFELTLPAPQSDLAVQMLKDPYKFDFLTLDADFKERELETGLIRHLERFLLELGAGFAFVGRQVHTEVDGDDFYIDLLFYHLKLRCYVVIDLKTGKFKPEYAGKMNFYLSAVDDLMRHPDDAPSIGLILCQEQKRIVAEYALREMKKPIGVSEYHLTRALPAELRSSLPTIEEIEAELMKDGGVDDGE